ncbi:MAG: C-terminal helicase domain-containing protein, partial [Myxococcota bacterium]
DHALYLVAERRKHALLEHLLTRDDCDSAIVFTRTKHRARRLAARLSEQGHRAVSLQGNLSQAQRDRAMRGFRSRRYDILVATDIAARGIDVSGVSHVINFDVPNTPEGYTHRIGRTGRAEREGVACTFVTGSDRGWVLATERMIGAAIPRRRVEGFEPDFDEKPEHRSSPRGSPRGARPGGHPRSSRRSSDGRRRSRRRTGTTGSARPSSR